MQENTQENNQETNIPIKAYQEAPKQETRQDQPETKTSSGGIFTTIFTALCFLLPLVFFPGVGALLFVSKLGLISIVSAVLLILFFLNVLNQGSIELPRTKIIWALVLLPLVALISSFFSGSLHNSITGNVFEIGTAGSFIILFFLFLVAVFAGLKWGATKKVLMAFLLSIAVCILHLLIVMLMNYGVIPVFSWFPASLIGNFVDLASLLGVGVIISLCAVNIGNVSSKMKIALWAIIVLSLLFIGAIAFKPVTLALGVFSLLIFVYLLSVSRGESNTWIKKSHSTLFVLIVSVIMIISGSSISGFLSRTLKVNSFDVRPSLGATTDIVKKQWMKNPVTGAGPNNFVKLWSLHKPTEVNQTNFWNADFFFGSGLVPTLAGTTGILGILAILAFLFFYAREGLWAFFVPVESEGKRFLPISTFLASLFLWIGAFFYPPGIVVLAFAFIFTGLFVSSMAKLGSGRIIKINIFSNPKTNFVTVLLVVALMIGIVTAGYFVSEKMVASVIFNRAVLAFNSNGDLPKAQASVARAASISPTDLYQRSQAELYLLNVEKSAANIPTGGDITESQRDELQGNVANAVNFAKLSIASDPKNYQNYLVMGKIYESLAIKGIQGAGDNAKAAYAEAEKLNPSNPAIQLAYARLAAVAGDAVTAKTLINKAIALKGNYTDAYFTLAQLESASNNVAGVVKAIESATLIDPSNAGLYFQLGLIKYQTRDNTGAASAFERAITIVPDYANAKYFLGLSYYNLGKKEDAIKQFEALKVSNPDNQEITLILTNLKAGKDPFTGAQPPIDSKPEDRKAPPIKEKSVE